MPRVCQITGRRTRTGRKVTRRGLPKYKGGIGLKTTGIQHRVFKPNLQWKRIWVPELKTYVRVRLSAKALKTIDKDGPFKVLLKAGIVRPPSQRKKNKKVAAKT
jgi:large subunit ribosomal protein L28